MRLVKEDWSVHVRITRLCLSWMLVVVVVTFAVVGVAQLFTADTEMNSTSTTTTPHPTPLAPFGCEPRIANCRALLPGVGHTIYSITCFAWCQDLYRNNFYLLGSFSYILTESPPELLFLFVLCCCCCLVCLFVGVLANAVSRVDVPNKVGHAAHRHKPVMQMPVPRQQLQLYDSLYHGSEFDLRLSFERLCFDLVSYSFKLLTVAGNY